MWQSSDKGLWTPEEMRLSREQPSWLLEYVRHIIISCEFQMANLTVSDAIKAVNLIDSELVRRR